MIEGLYATSRGKESIMEMSLHLPGHQHANHAQTAAILRKGNQNKVICKPKAIYVRKRST